MSNPKLEKIGIFIGNGEMYDQICPATVIRIGTIQYQEVCPDSIAEVGEIQDTIDYG